MLRMSNPIDFRIHAMDCLRLAERAKARRHKAVLLGIAQAWVQLADQATNLQASRQDGSESLHAQSELNA
jgi:hypothetical protein